MAFQLNPIMLYLLFLLMCTVLFRTDAQNQVLPGCPSTCGNFSIPYPFGIGENCYAEKGFEIVCSPRDADNNTFTPILAITGSQIMELSLEELRVSGSTFNSCYDGQFVEGEIGANYMLNLSSGPFSLSAKGNKLIAFGCDIFAYIFDLSSGRYASGCSSLCDGISSKIDLLNGSCYGFGCCEEAIPSGLKAFNLSIVSRNRQSGSSTSNSTSCSIAALHDGSPFGSINRSVATLDWSLGSDSCQGMEPTGENRCGLNTVCVNSTTGVGIRCRCRSGYEGNPYLPQGCQDIDECKVNPLICGNATRCTNEPGSYWCQCARGYTNVGDGVCLPFNGSERFSKMEVILIGLGSGFGLLLLLALAYWFYRKLKLRKEIKLKESYFKINGGLLLQQQITSGEGNVDKTRIFVADELERATDYFSECRVLGKGGSGTVYKGMLPDGRIVAIKRSKIADRSQVCQFINELVILAQINHKHVVKLLGCCLETEVPLLVYEYISNGTLSHHLHDDSRESSLSWETRLRISIEIAGALSYLHSSTSTPIFHRDIKSSNILLDERYKATVADFGLSRSVPYEKTHLTTLVQGTFGYLDPEYFRSGQFTEKSDVYSFGVILVELLTGQRPISFARSEEDQNLAIHFISSLKQGRLYQILETQVLNEAGKEEVFVVAKLAKRCLKLVGKKRPTMKEVLAELEGLRRHQEQPLIQKYDNQDMSFVEDQYTLSMIEPPVSNSGYGNDTVRQKFEFYTF